MAPRSTSVSSTCLLSSRNLAKCQSSVCVRNPFNLYFIPPALENAAFFFTGHRAIESVKHMKLNHHHFFLLCCMCVPSLVQLWFSSIYVYCSSAWLPLKSSRNEPSDHLWNLATYHACSTLSSFLILPRHAILNLYQTLILLLYFLFFSQTCRFLIWSSCLRKFTSKGFTSYSMSNGITSNFRFQWKTQKNDIHIY